MQQDGTSEMYYRYNRIFYEICLWNGVLSMKDCIMRGANGFCYSIAITALVQLVVMVISGGSILLPEYAAPFDNELTAYGVVLMLVGVISAIAAGGTVLLELKRPGLVVQSVLYFLLMLVTWIPVACLLWGFHKYVTSFVSTILSIVVTYGICWGVQYRLCIRDVKRINERLQEQQTDNAA